MRKLLTTVLLLLLTISIEASKKPKFDYSLVVVPEEGGIKFERITEDADGIFSEFLVGKNSSFLGSMKKSTLDWWVNPQIAISPDGKKIGYINYKNKTSNIMIKSASKGGSSVQRTFRTNVEDFTWSHDGKTLCFTEIRGGHHGIYLVNADQGSVVQQISNGNENDLGGVLSRDGKTGLASYTLWSYDRDSNLFSNYSRGMTPCLIPDNPHTIYCGRFTDKKESEIWRINFETGVEEVILAQPGKSFTTPQLSPDGKWLLCTGSSISEKEQINNTDIFVIRTDGTGFTQLTYHPGNDLSAIWAPDGKSILFLSQRGSADRIYNVWKMNFNLQ